MSTSPQSALRPAEPADSADLLHWRNDPQTRANSRNTGLVAVDEHEAWLERVLRDPNRRVWIAECEAEKLGTVSVVLAGSRVELSITVAPHCRGRGVGSAMVRSAVVEARRVWPDAAIEAVVRLENEVSRRVFERCGFRSVREDHAFRVLRYMP